MPQSAQTFSMTSATITVLATLVFLIPSGNSHAQDVASPSYFGVDGTSPPLRLGKGFAQNDLMRIPLYDCFEYQVDTPTATGAATVALDFVAAQSTEGILQSMNIDMNASYHNIGASLDANFIYSRSVASRQQSVNVVVRAMADYPNRPILNPTLKAEFKQLLETGSADEFVSRCGSRLPTVEQRGVRLYALVTIENASLDLRQKVAASIGGSYGTGPLSANAKTSFNQEMNSDTSRSKVGIKVFARGGDAPTVLAGLVEAAIKNKTSLDEIGKALADYARTMSADKAATLGFWVSDIPELDSAKKDPWLVERQQALKTLFDKYADLSDRRARIADVLEGRDRRAVEYSNETKARLANSRTTVSQGIEAVAQAHAACKAAKLPDLTPCTKLPPAIAAAEAVWVPAPIQKPSILWAIGVRRGISGRNADLKPWEILSPVMTDSVFASGSAGLLPPPKPDSLDQYFTSFRTRLLSVVPDAHRMFHGILVRGERIDGIELIAELAPNVSAPTLLSESRRVSLAGWGLAQLDSFFLAQRWAQPMQGYLPDDILLKNDQGYLTEPPPCPDFCAPFFASDKQKAWKADYNEREFFDVESFLTPKIEILAPLKVWIKAGVANGSMSLNLRIKDRFAEKAIEPQIFLATWRRDNASKGYEVRYGATTGEPMASAFISDGSL